LNDPVQKEGILSIGKIVGAHGIKGAVKVYSYAESPSIFRPDRSILLEDKNGHKRSLSVNWARPHKQGVVLSFKGIDTRSDAEALIGSKLFIHKKELPEPEPGDYYWTDIIGLSVYRGDGNYLGKITSILPTGSNDVYIVRDEDNKETLIPALESVVIEIDVEQKMMRVDLPEGLE
jgi:16S rRNA processing protein RimM